MKRIINLKKKFSCGKEMCKKIRFFIFIVAQVAGLNFVYGAGSNEIQPYLAFSASGSVTIRLSNDKIVKGILNTVDGFPLSIKSEQDI
ncbi:MAG: hypothetical protein LBC68_12720, partial [Prevotellaceae bacterium]|nr:hypothetical protein [Prevotellaceae bacterium]